MRKQFIVGLIASMVVTAMLMIWSCKKGDINDHRKHKNGIVKYSQFVKSVSKEFKANTIDNGRISDYAWYIIKEDLNGAAIGATLSGGGPHFIGCAAFGAGLFSFMAHMPYYGDDNCGDLVCMNCTSSSYANSLNPYDNIGLTHNVVLSEILANRALVTSVSGNDCPINYAACVDEIRNGVSGETASTNAQLDSILSSQFMLDEIDLLVNSMGYSNITNEAQNRLDYMEENNLITSEVKDVLETYYFTLFDLSSYQDVYDYTEDLENAIGEFELSPQEEKVLYAVFSTCRYSAGMWFNGEILD